MDQTSKCIPSLKAARRTSTMRQIGSHLLQAMLLKIFQNLEYTQLKKVDLQDIKIGLGSIVLSGDYAQLACVENEIKSLCHLPSINPQNAQRITQNNPKQPQEQQYSNERSQLDTSFERSFPDEALIPNIKKECKQISSSLELVALKDRHNLSRSLQKDIAIYLTGLINPRRQLNYFCQIMSLPYPDYSCAYQNGYRVTADIMFVSRYLNNTKVRFTSFGQSREKKEATINAANELLKMIYGQIPQMWKDFVSVKLKKGIVA